MISPIRITCGTSISCPHNTPLAHLKGTRQSPCYQCRRSADRLITGCYADRHKNPLVRPRSPATGPRSPPIHGWRPHLSWPSDQQLPPCLTQADVPAICRYGVRILLMPGALFLSRPALPAGHAHGVGAALPAEAELRQEAGRFTPGPAEFVAGRSRPVGHGPKRNQGHDVVEGCPRPGHGPRHQTDLRRPRPRRPGLQRPRPRSLEVDSGDEHGVHLHRQAGRDGPADPGQLAADQEGRPEFAQLRGSGVGSRLKVDVSTVTLTVRTPSRGIMIGAARREESGDLRIYNQRRLEPGMVDSVEPGVPGRLPTLRRDAHHRRRSHVPHDVPAGHSLPGQGRGAEKGLRDPVTWKPSVNASWTLGKRGPAGIGGRTGSDSVDGFHGDGWTTWIGTGGRFQARYSDACSLENAPQAPFHLRWRRPLSAMDHSGQSVHSLRLVLNSG